MYDPWADTSNPITKVQAFVLSRWSIVKKKITTVASLRKTEGPDPEGAVHEGSLSRPQPHIPSLYQASLLTTVARNSSPTLQKETTVYLHTPSLVAGKFHHSNGLPTSSYTVLARRPRKGERTKESKTRGKNFFPRPISIFQLFFNGFVVRNLFEVQFSGRFLGEHETMCVIFHPGP